MKRTVIISALALMASCSELPSASEHLAPVLGALTIETLSYSAHVSCQVTNASSIETACAVLEGEDSIREIPITISDDIISIEINRLQSGTSYSIRVHAAAGDYATDSGIRQFVTSSGPRAIYPADSTFEKYLLDRHDIDHDGVLNIDEARRITDIDTRTNGIRSMDEIRYMPNLFYLNLWNTSEQPGQLTHLDLSGCPNLIDLNCDFNQIEAIDLSACPYLERICFSNNSISEIDLSHNPELHTINFDSNLLSAIDVGAQKKLRILNINANRSIRSISIPCPENIQNFTIGDTRITDFDLSTMPNLEVYGGNNLPIRFVPDLSGHPHMTEIHLCCEGGAFWLEDTDFFTQYEDLEGLNICGYKPDHIDLSKNTKLHMLWISIANNLVELDLSTAPQLEILEFCDCEKLKRIYVHQDVVIENLKTLRGNCKAEILHKP